MKISLVIFAIANPSNINGVRGCVRPLLKLENHIKHTWQPLWVVWSCKWVVSIGDIKILPLWEL